MGKFVARAATDAGIPADKLAAMLIGRWPSGAPIMRVPGADNPSLAEDTFANNHFIFDDNPKELYEVIGEFINQLD